MHRIVNDEALDSLFRAARCHYAWLARPVGDTLLRAVWELVKLAPVSGCDCPPRIVFIKSEEAKARLEPAVPPDLRAGFIAAPVAAVIGCDRDRADGEGGTLQAAYLIMAARALGLDCGPAWRFDNAIVDAAFFPDGGVAASFLCALGYGNDAQPPPEAQRLGSDEACTIL